MKNTAKKRGENGEWFDSRNVLLNEEVGRRAGTRGLLVGTKRGKGKVQGGPFPPVTAGLVVGAAV